VLAKTEKSNSDLNQRQKAFINKRKMRIPLTAAYAAQRFFGLTKAQPKHLAQIACLLVRCTPSA